MGVLGKHLYSTPMVAIRELVQNAHDSIIRRWLEAPGWNAPGRIEVFSDPARKAIRIIDNEVDPFLTAGVSVTILGGDANPFQNTFDRQA
ncbi:hypothetical protein FACS189475_05530 [Betaproteobacteria bacterium]|nr:hypothetical protein FACS189475_05530 [Betaproteobacteria bacterium]